MLALPAKVTIWLYTQPTDMRKSFDGLGALVAASGLSVLDAGLFVFTNRVRDRVKILGFEGDGLAIWYKRLEAGRYQWPPGSSPAPGSSPGSFPGSFPASSGGPLVGASSSASPSQFPTLQIDAAQLRLILDGIDWRHVRRRKRYQHAKSCG